MHKCNKGFTLLEMLVALVLISLIVTLSFQFFSNVVNIFNRQLKQVAIVNNYRAQNWLAQILSNMVWTDDSWGKGGTGDITKIKGLTLASPDDVEGTPVMFILEIKNQVIGGQLQYQSGQDSPIVLLEWEDGVAEWHYRNQAGQTISSWKKQEPGQSEGKDQPKYAILRLNSSNGPTEWYFPINDRVWLRKADSSFLGGK